MSEKFNLEIISPNEIVLKSEAEEVIIPAFEGQMTILKDHIALITYLRPGYIKVSNSNKKEVFFVEEGTVEFSKNNLLILSSNVIQMYTCLAQQSIFIGIQFALQDIACCIFKILLCSSAMSKLSNATQTDSYKYRRN